MQLVVENPDPQDIVVITVRQAAAGVQIVATCDGQRHILGVLQNSGRLWLCRNIPASFGFNTTSEGKLEVE